MVYRLWLLFRVVLLPVNEVPLRNKIWLCFQWFFIDAGQTLIFVRHTLEYKVKNTKSVLSYSNDAAILMIKTEVIIWKHNRKVLIAAD